MKKFIFGLLLSLISTVSLAHITAYPRTGVAGAYALISVNVPHGCFGSATKSITVTAPIVGLLMHPAPKANWTISFVEKDLPVDLYYNKNEFGEYYGKEITEVTWVGSLPEGLSEQFMISIKTPKEPQILEFDVHQVCENGRVFNYTKDQKHSTKEIMYESPMKFEIKEVK